MDFSFFLYLVQATTLRNRNFEHKSGEHGENSPEGNGGEEAEKRSREMTEE